MNTRFAIDLANPGTLERSRWDWFLGAQGRRHLFIVAGAGAGLIALVALAGILPRYLKYSNELASIAALKKNVTTTTTEAATLRASLRDLATEARRQVRWSELLPALSRRIPDALRIDKVSLAKTKPSGPSAAAAGATPAGGELALQIDASTTMAAGGARLEEIANFIGVLTTEPTIERRFQMKTWEVKSPRERAPDGLLQISIGLTEKKP